MKYSALPIIQAARSLARQKKMKTRGWLKDEERSAENRSTKEIKMAKREHNHKPYAKPELNKQANLRDLTFECAAWSCSVAVPPAT